MHHVTLAFHSIYGCSDEKSENRDGKEGMRFIEEVKEWRLPGLLYTDDLALCVESTTGDGGTVC